MSDIEFRKANSSDLEKITPYLKEFMLDCENLACEQFYIAEINGEIVGFGRIKPYEDICELSSLGVIPEYRKNGVGKALVQKIIENFPNKDVWITTKVPGFFAKSGFKEVTDPPEVLKQKTERICASVCRSSADSRFMLYSKPE